MLSRMLYTRIDNSQLIVFRFFFGILVAFESFGAIATGWVKETLIEPKFTFSFIGFEWLQPLPGNGMYFYFFVMGALGIFIAIGYKYRISIISFTLLWISVYLMQKSSYNNHYYLLALVSSLMCFFPANRSYSIDAKRNKTLLENTMFSYIKWIVIAQLFIVYTYASLAKLYVDWLDFGAIEIMMKGKANYPLIGAFLQQNWVHKTIGLTGIVFDLLIVPVLLWKPTRKTTFCISIFFHLFNSIIFQIGIFPYLALAFSVFFFDPETIRRIFLKNKVVFQKAEFFLPKNKNITLSILSLFFLVQAILPLRHHVIEDNVLWTEEGHRLSWRMMLRSRNGIIKFKLVDKANRSSKFINLDEYLTKKQKRKIAAYPDFIWQFAQHLKIEYAKRNMKIEVYAVQSKVSVNGRPLQNFIDSNVDLASITWNHFKHNEWILPSNWEE